MTVARDVLGYAQRRVTPRVLLGALFAPDFVTSVETVKVAVTDVVPVNARTFLALELVGGAVAVLRQERTYERIK